MSHPAPAPSAPSGPERHGPTTTRAFRPGAGFVLLLVALALTVLLALAAAVTGALGATGASRILGGLALLIVGGGLLATLRVPARSAVINAPRLRLERNRARAAQRAEARAGDSPSAPGTDLAARRGPTSRLLTTADVVSGPVTGTLAATAAGRSADAALAGTTAGEGLLRVAQLLAGAVGFVLLALGLASVLGQVLS